MDILESMKAELAAWNNGGGIVRQSWVGVSGAFGLAVGYSATFWPELVEFEGYLLRAGFSLESLRAFEKRDGIDRAGVEAVMNHLHIADIQYYGCPDGSADKLLGIGTVLKEIHEAKLRWQYPSRSCRVSRFVPTNPEDRLADKVTSWQRDHDGKPV